MSDGYFEYKLDGAHKICVQSFSFDPVYRIWVQVTTVLSFDRVRLESVQPFARFNTFDRVCLIASVQPTTFDQEHEESIH
jgi:hypothetical protein